MSLLAISYPTLSPDDLAWIQAIRAQYDSQYAIVDPHITLVFPFDSLQPGRMIDHLHHLLQGEVPISLTFTCALVVKDHFSPATYTFLVPDQGFGALVKLHDKLYSDKLASELRLDIPYIPHITLAVSAGPQLCKHVADEINHQNRRISATVDTIDIVSFVEGKVTTQERIALHFNRVDK